MQPSKEASLMQAICPIALILRSPNVHVKPILHINTEDVAVTRQIVDAGKLLDVDVLDHLIIGRQRFVSLKERGLGFD
jgi:DNA repair protein RadC